MDGLAYGHRPGHRLGHDAGLSLATVTDTVDPDGRGRVKVRLVPLDVEVWAPLVVASAGQGYGVAFLPKLQEIVLVAFLTPEQPLVLGAVWSGGQSAPGAAAPAQERYSVTMPSGLHAVFDDGDGPSVTITTPAGHSLTVTDAAGGKLAAAVGATNLTLTPSEIDLTVSGEVKLQAASVSVTAAQVTVNAGISRFSGVVQCDTLMASSVVGASYSPGAGNLW